MTIVDQIIDLFERRGSAAYHGEAVSQTEHALQAAFLAEREAAPDALVAAALLHDVGHLLEGQDEDLALHGVDGRHEIAGQVFLTQSFGPEVVEPIALHVAAKRYLCAVEPAYLEALSPSSRLSLELQGGPMTPEEQTQFERHPFHREALRLRRWDDAAKEVGLKTPGLEHYRGNLAAAAR